MTNIEINDPKPPEDNVDLELAVAMSEVDILFEDYVKVKIGEPAFWAYKEQERVEEEASLSVPQFALEDIISKSQHDFSMRAAEKGMNLLDEGFDAATAIAQGRIDALYDAIEEAGEEEDPYMEAWDEISRRLTETFDLNAQGEFSLNSVDSSVLNVSLPPTLDLRTEIRYRPVGMGIETRAYYLRELPSVHGPFAMELKEVPIDLTADRPLGSIDVKQLQKDVLAVLKETLADLKTAA